MNNKAMFEACSTQCVWCLEQWPVIEHREHIVHVAPFTKDPLLFHRVCSAESIRRGFQYMDFKGTKVKKWVPPSTLAIKKSLDAYYGKVDKENDGIGHNISSPKNRSFWRTMHDACIEVASWPDWMKGQSVSGRKPKTPPEETADLKRTRDELLFYDAMDYWTRQPCSDNLHVPPDVPRLPTCNDGFGCTTCWERYEQFYDKERAAWCD